MIKFNEVTWYSKLAAVIFLLVIFPMLTFYIGIKYQETRDIPKVLETPYTPTPNAPDTIFNNTPEDVPGSIPTPKSSETKELHVGQTQNINGIEITLKNVIEDSRCPIDVQCIQAGNIVANVVLKSYDMVSVTQMSSDKTLNYDSHIISIIRVSPPQNSGRSIISNEYILLIKVDRI